MPRLLLAALAAAVLIGCASAPRPHGPFLGQPLPGAEPVLFAPGLVNGGMRTRDIAMTPDGRELYFGQMVGGYRYTTVLAARQQDDGSWSDPAVLPLAADPRWHVIEPHVAPDGRRLFFVSDRPEQDAGEPGDEDLWVAERLGDGWSDPVRLPAPINTDSSEFFPSVTRDGALYFTRRDPESRREFIFRARPDGRSGWLEPEQLPETVNAAPTQFNAFVDPDERYLIVCLANHPDNLGQIDYWIAFRDPDDSWHGPVNLGDTVNGPGREGWSPYVSPDGRAFFFMSARDHVDQDQPLTAARMRELHATPGNGLGHTWWMDAGFLEELRP